MEEKTYKVSEIVTGLRNRYGILQSDLNAVKKSLIFYGAKYFDIQKTIISVDEAGNISFFIKNNDETKYLGDICVSKFFEEKYYNNDKIYIINEELDFGINYNENFLIASHLHNILINPLIRNVVNYEMENDFKKIKFKLNQFGVSVSFYEKEFLDFGIDYVARKDHVHTFSSFKDNHSEWIKKAFEIKIPANVISSELQELILKFANFDTKVVFNNHDVKYDIYEFNYYGTRVLRKK